MDLVEQLNPLALADQVLEVIFAGVEQVLAGVLIDLLAVTGDFLEPGLRVGDGKVALET